MIVHTIVRLDTPKVELPAQVLAVDLAKVGYEEGIFLACLAVFRVNSINALLERLPNQLLGTRSVDDAMMIGKS